jgi:hypothetical protein
MVARTCFRYTGKKTNPHLLRDMIVTHVRDSNATEKVCASSFLPSCLPSFLPLGLTDDEPNPTPADDEWLESYATIRVTINEGPSVIPPFPSLLSFRPSFLLSFHFLCAASFLYIPLFTPLTSILPSPSPSLQSFIFTLHFHPFHQRRPAASCW